MNNAQTSIIIKELCKRQNITVSRMLAETSIRRSLIYDMEKRDYTPSAEILEKIADYLNCSVDYLLGRKNTVNGEYSIYGNNNVQAINYSPLTLNSNHNQSSREDDELLSLIQDLPLVKKAEVILYINELKKQN